MRTLVTMNRHFNLTSLFEQEKIVYIDHLHRAIPGLSLLLKMAAWGSNSIDSKGYCTLMMNSSIWPEKGIYSIESMLL